MGPSGWPKHWVSSVGTKINDLDLSVRGRLRSRQPLCHIHHLISRKPLQI